MLWRASRLSTVLFHSHLSAPTDGKDRHRVFGRCELAWHETGGGSFAGPGWFGALNEVDGDTAAESVWENAALADALYLEQEGTGTTACVVGFHDASDDADKPPAEFAREVVRHAAVNFFPAMAAGKLAVTAEVYDSGKHFRDGKASSTQTANPADHLPAQVRMLERFRTGDVKEQFEEEAGEVVAVEVSLTVPKRNAEPKHSEQAHQAVLLLTPADENEPDGAERWRFQLALFRGPGMVVTRLPLQAA